MILCNLLSSSRGNATLLSSGSQHYLIDAGKSPSEIEDLMRPLGITYEQISGIILTHLHGDHFYPGHIKTLLKNNMKLYVDNSHLGALAKKRKAFIRLYQTGRVITYTEQKRFYLDEKIGFYPVSVPHDSIGKTFGFIFDIVYHQQTKKISFFSDLGNMPSNLYPWILNSDILALEHNYDEEMLWTSNRPLHLKRRIAGDWGHLSNEKANRIIRTSLSKSYKYPCHILLLHLSQECNSPDLPLQLLQNTLLEYEQCQNTRIHTAKPDKISDIINIF